MKTIGPILYVFLLAAFIATGQNEDAGTTYDQNGPSYGYDIDDPEEIKKNILSYASDSLLTIRQVHQTKFKKKPKPGGSGKTMILKDTDLAVLDFVNGYYKVAVDKEVFYVNPKNLQEPNFDLSNKQDYVVKLRSIKDSIAEEAEKRKYLEDQLKKEEYYVSKWGQAVYDRVLMGDCWLGMTEEMAKVAGLYPGPRYVNTMVTVYGKREKWLCRNGMVLVFDFGILKAFENSYDLSPAQP